MIDARTADTNEFEIVMSGAILLMVLAHRLGHSEVTVSSNGTAVGLGFLLRAGIFVPR